MESDSVTPTTTTTATATTRPTGLPFVMEGMRMVENDDGTWTLTSAPKRLPRNPQAELQQAISKLSVLVTETPKWGIAKEAKAVDLVVRNEAEYLLLDQARKAFYAQSQAFLQSMSSGIGKVVKTGKRGLFK